MKCQYCGNTLNIEDKFCRACGRPNPLARQHQQDMEKYKNQYEQTRQDVIKKTRSFTSITVPVIVLAVLLLLCVVSGIFYARAWDIGYDIRARKTESNSGKHRETIEKYIAEGDYVSLEEYWNLNDLYSTDALREYSAVENAASCYARLFEDITTDHFMTYRSRENTITYVCEDLSRLFKIEQDYTYDKDIYLTPEKQAVIDKIRTKALYLISSVCNITYEEAQSLTEMSSTKQRAFLAERWADNEEQDI